LCGGSEVVTVVLMSTSIFRNVTPRKSIVVSEQHVTSSFRFEETYVK
jgi:hypothetical protein